MHDCVTTDPLEFSLKPSVFCEKSTIQLQEQAMWITVTSGGIGHDFSSTVYKLTPKSLIIPIKISPEYCPQQSARVTFSMSGDKEKDQTKQTCS